MTYPGLTVAFAAPLVRIDVTSATGAATGAIASLARACDIAARDDISVALLALPAALPASDDSTATAAARALELLPQPVIACIDGPIEGPWLEIALACDVRIATAAATFAMPQVRDGAMPSAGGTQRLPRIVGRTKAAEMILLGATLDAPAALACGLVNAIAAGAAITEGAAIADRIARQGPLAVRYAKEAILRGLDMPLEQALRYETDLTVILQTTDDRAEGVRAFLEKRPPRFEGR